ncbi:MAG TPA: DsbA family protein [Caulobacteraceae bacterium]|jgi:protein-disulfide isomerase|nr:DsbA family protein [Caulobacteraceae bacterium]
MRFFALIAAIALIAIPAAGCSPSGKAPGQAAAGDQIRAYILAHPEVIEEAIGKLQERRQAAADTQLKAQLVANRSKVERDPRDYVAGNPNGKVTVVEFFDYRCPYCKAALPEIAKLIADNKDVRFVFKEFPILSPISETAARAAYAAKAQGKYWPVHQALLAEKNLDGESIDRILRDNGVDVARAHADGAGKATTDFLEETRALGRATGVNGTPAFIIGDRMVSGWVPADIQAGIAEARKKS